ncbi:hypothetical protein PR202_gb14349 [Eleusine coracana subsp. coracana]|uniref:Disease resistance protein winged helix domain-containing protein n=1 Tax=Eleusine coracana subsp. coracana TaxID=191504 RepID=A0AAV5EV48_ELECO|nr:hypothetical protein PR202_gb14349 [Eleusine coracana subsp. coracana]
MEAMEASSVEAAVIWLAQIIPANLLLDKLDAWLRQVGLADQTEKLSTEIERIETVVTAVKGRTLGNKPLLRSLARLKELLYDADDLFLAEDLIDIWISQGFVRCDNSSKIEDTGQEYLNDLVDWGFFEQADTRDSQICYIVMMPALIHEFARSYSAYTS